MASVMSRLIHDVQADPSLFTRLPVAPCFSTSQLATCWLPVGFDLHASMSLHLLYLYPLCPSLSSSAVMPLRRLLDFLPFRSPCACVRASVSSHTCLGSCPCWALGELATELQWEPLTQGLTQSRTRSACSMSWLRRGWLRAWCALKPPESPNLQESPAQETPETPVPSGAASAL